MDDEPLDAWVAIHRARFAAEADGSQVGWAEVAHEPWRYDPDRYAVRIEVDPAMRRRGIGSQLLGELIAHVAARGGRVLRAVAAEDDRAALGFLDARDFREVWRNLPSRLVLDEVDAGRVGDAERRLAVLGLRVTTLAERADDLRLLRELYDLELLAGRDQRHVDPVTPPPFERWVPSVVDAPEAMLDAWFLAFDVDRLVGVTTLEATRQPAVVEVGYTAVHPDYRRRGIARLLKLRTIEYARERGFRAIETDSDWTNDSMLALNASIGFVRLPAVITFERRLA